MAFSLNQLSIMPCTLRYCSLINVGITSVFLFSVHMKQLVSNAVPLFSLLLALSEMPLDNYPAICKLHQMLSYVNRSHPVSLYDKLNAMRIVPVH